MNSFFLCIILYTKMELYRNMMPDFPNGTVLPDCHSITMLKKSLSITFPWALPPPLWHPPDRISEEGMNGSSRPNHENHYTLLFYEGSPLQDLSEHGGGSAVFTTIHLETDLPRGRPVGGGGVHRKYL